MSGIFLQYPKLLEEEYVETYDFANCWTVLNPEAQYENEDVAAALMQSHGNISDAARLLKRPRRSLSNHIARTLELVELQDDLWQEFIDEIEGRHKMAAMNGDLGTQRFFLQTRGKDRGYTTRTETTGANGRPIESNLSFKNVPDDVLEALMNAQDAK